jgi:hypothetical protein
MISSTLRCFYPERRRRRAETLTAGWGWSLGLTPVRRLPRDTSPHPQGEPQHPVPDAKITACWKAPMPAQRSQVPGPRRGTSKRLRVEVGHCSLLLLDMERAAAGGRDVSMAPALPHTCPGMSQRAGEAVHRKTVTTRTLPWKLPGHTSIVTGFVRRMALRRATAGCLW